MIGLTAGHLRKQWLLLDGSLGTATLDRDFSALSPGDLVDIFILRCILLFFLDTALALLFILGLFIVIALFLFLGVASLELFILFVVISLLPILLGRIFISDTTLSHASSI